MGVTQRFKNLFTSTKKSTEQPKAELPVVEIEMAPIVQAAVAQDAPVDDGFYDVQADFDKIQSQLNNLTESEFAAKAAYLLSSINPVQVEYTKQVLADRGYAVHTILPSTDEAVNEKARSIFVYALVPADTNKPAIIACRGTDFSDIHSAVHNIDPNGPAHGAIRDTAKVILSDIADKCSGHSKLRITGHSQGGSISQLIYTEILEQKALQEASEYAEAGASYLPELSDLSLQVFQSAGVSDTVCERAKIAAEQVAKSGVKLSAKYFIRSWDVVNLTGSKALVGVSPEVAEVSLIRVTEKDHRNYLKFDRAEDFSVQAGANLAKEVAKKPSVFNFFKQIGKKLMKPFTRQMGHVALEAHTKNGFISKKAVPLEREEEDFVDVIGVVNDYQEDSWNSFDSERAHIEQYTNETPEDSQSMKAILNRDVPDMDPTGALKAIRTAVHTRVAGKSVEELQTEVVEALGGATVVKAVVSGALVANHIYNGVTGFYPAYDAIRSTATISSVVCGLDGANNVLEAGQGLHRLAQMVR